MLVKKTKDYAASGTNVSGIGLLTQEELDLEKEYITSTLCEGEG
jgi:hypothetical protein